MLVNLLSCRLGTTSVPQPANSVLPRLCISYISIFYIRYIFLDCIFNIFLYFYILYSIYIPIYLGKSCLGHPVFVWEEISWFCKKGKGEPFVEIILEIGGVACLPGNKKLVEGKTETSQEKSLLATISLFVFATSTRPLNNNEKKYNIKSNADQKQTNKDQQIAKLSWKVI